MGRGDHGGTRRHACTADPPARAGLALVAALALLVSCQSWSIGLASGDVALISRLPPATAAWLAAETARDCFPSADPVPQHAGAPIVQTAPDRFVVDCARRPPGGYRIAMSGRIRPPRFRGPELIASAGEAVFAPAGTATSVAPGAVDRAVVRIDPHGTGAQLTIRLSGAARNAGMLEKLRAGIELAEALHASGSSLHEKRYPEARRAATEALLREDPLRSRFHAPLRARVRLHLAASQIAEGDLAGARHSACAALADDATCHAARLLVARLDARTAEREDLYRHLRMLGSVPGPVEMAHAAARQLDLVPDPNDDAAPRELANAWLAHGDPEAAFHWIRRARDGLPAGEATLALQATVYRQLDLRAAARDTALVELVTHGFRPELILGLSDDYLALHEPRSALHLLARYWREFPEDLREAARRRAAAAVARLGPEIGVRVMLAESIDPDELDPRLDVASVRHPWATPVRIDEADLGEDARPWPARAAVAAPPK